MTNAHPLKTCCDASRSLVSALAELSHLHTEIDHAHPDIRAGYNGVLCTTESAVSTALRASYSAFASLPWTDDLPPILAAAADTLLALEDAHVDGLLRGLLLDHWTGQMRRLALEVADYIGSAQDTCDAERLPLAA